jgi:uncharacterized membrane protein
MRLAWILFAAQFFSFGLRAELNFCNSTPLTIETAAGYPAGDQWFTEGWYIIQPGECATVLAGDLTNRYYYSFAQTSGGKFRWNGNFSMCTAHEAFTIRHAECDSASQEPFTQIDIGNAHAFNNWFTCPNCLDQSLVSAIRRYVPYIEQLANQQAPLSYRTPGWQDIGPVDIQYGLSRGAFQIGFDGNRISISTRISYWISVSNDLPIIGRNGLASCGVDEEEPVADITIETIFGVKNDGHLHSKTRITNLSFPNPCNLTFLNIDARGYIDEAVRPQLDRLAAAVDSQMASIDVSPLVNVGRLYASQ